MCLEHNNYLIFVNDNIAETFMMSTDIWVWMEVHFVLAYNRYPVLIETSHFSQKMKWPAHNVISFEIANDSIYSPLWCNYMFAYVMALYGNLY